MEQYVIKGGNPLVGEVDIAGAKNAALAILSAAIMTDETILIENLPDVRDINVLLEAISEIGAQVERIDKSTVKINGSTIGNLSVDYEFIKKIRASYYLLGALLGKYKHAEVPLPGGCNIGSRPIDQHLKGFRALGADVDICHGAIVAKAENLHGSHIFLDVVSVGATINIMMAASMATGRTIIENAAREPHVVDVANFLNSMGANIKGAGTDVIRIRGVETLHRTEYSIIPDQIEAGTFMFAAAATRGDVTVRNVIPKHLEATTAKLEEIGCEVEEFDDAVRVRAPHVLHRTHVKTLPYPGYPTDMQPQIAVTLALAEGTSIVTESIFENRFKYADELSRMGANIKVEGNSAIIDGVRKLTGARVSAPDLRAGAALVIAGLAAEGVTVVDDIVYIKRGYDALCQCVHHENIILGIGLAEIGGPILQLACLFILQLPHGRVQKRRGPVDLVFFQRQRIRADGLHGAAHLAGHGAAVQPAAHLFFPDAAHNGFQAAVVAHAHHCSLGRLDDVLPDGIAVFIPGDGAVLIVFRGLRCHTQPAGGEKAAVSALQRVFHHRLQVRVHRGVNTQAAVVQQIGRLGAVQAILLRKSGGHIRQHLVGEIGRDRRFRHRHIARRKADGLGRGGIVLFLGNIALLPLDLVAKGVKAGRVSWVRGSYR